QGWVGATQLSERGPESVRCARNGFEPDGGWKGGDPAFGGGPRKRSPKRYFAGNGFEPARKRSPKRYFASNGFEASPESVHRNVAFAAAANPAPKAFGETVLLRATVSNPSPESVRRNGAL